MHMEFEAPSLARREEYLAALSKMPQKASDYSFGNIYGWAESYGLEWAFTPDYVLIRQTIPHVVYWAPVGNWDAVDWTGCPCIAAGMEFIRIPETLANSLSAQLGDKIEVKELRDHFDYLYSVQELIELKGNRFHKKKNLLKQFSKHYDFEYHVISPDCIEEVLEMQSDWCLWREDECNKTLIAENKAISRVLKTFDRQPELFGGTIKVDGKVIAYTVAEELEPGTVVIHFEKGHTNFKGVYQAINQQFLEHTASQYDIVNREQDIGDEGLRKAKMSYNPVGFLKKYNILVK
ncbi:DUF2156 domain-containing protein [Desulfovibrio inopinatus]|uniref:DUF2156 domain-containing protein n=1 Tax=Desulfovibrio inopinatus TaxID=102109 RepID=UPI00040BAA4E|nr:phosphatidylglycerol lysyltransferase domain-containing protein [Desulfovibrio inopinatus]